MTDKPRTAVPYDWLEDADEELKAIAKQHERDYTLTQLDRELGLETPEDGPCRALPAFGVNSSERPYLGRGCS
jgi:hypothetical protein